MDLLLGQGGAWEHRDRKWKNRAISTELHTHRKREKRNMAHINSQWREWKKCHLESFWIKKEGMGRMIWGRWLVARRERSQMCLPRGVILISSMDKDHFKKFYWSIADLQCCVSFRYIAKWFSYTYIHSFSDSFLIKVTTEYWVEFFVLYSESLLIIYLIYSSMYVNPKLLIHPSPLHVSPLVTTSLFSIPVSLFLLCK